MVKQPRGRPVGTSPYRHVDDAVLRKAAVLLMSGSARNPTQAFRDILPADLDDHVLRRLQRRWLSERDTIFAEFEASGWNPRWEYELQAFRRAQPELYERTIRPFIESEGGAAAIAEALGGDPNAQPMALGPLGLWELIQKHMSQGATAADRTFDELLAHWSRFGKGPDATFLRRIAERCVQHADALEMADAQQAPKKKGRAG